MKPPVDKIIGEAFLGRTRYYFASHDGGIAHRFKADTFADEYPELVETYRLQVKNKTLPDFDPSAHYVHPLSRINQTEQDNRSASKTATSRSSDEVEVIPDSQEEGDDEDGDEDDEDYGGSSSQRTPPRTTRSITKKKELPFSPRKSRSQKILRVAESESEADDSDIQVVRTLRRSTRSKKTTEINLVSEPGSDDDADYDGPRSRSHKKGKSKKKVKSAQPMYGHFRSVTTLDEDPFSDDDENQSLRQHRQICEKCHLGPAHKLLAAFKKKPKGKGRKRKRSTDDEFEESEGEETYIELGGWVRCLKCPVSAHWKCLASTQRDEVLRAVREKDRELAEANHQGDDAPKPKKRSALDIEQTTEFICGACTKGGICMGCQEVALAPDLSRSKPDNMLQGRDAQDIVMADETNLQESVVHSLARELLFRCFTCKRLAHYAHLPKPSVLGKDADIADIAEHYQNAKKWLCADCASFTYPLDKIIAWRPYPAQAVEPDRGPDELPNYKSLLPREYLVKWAGRSFRRLDWVPHMWLVSTNPSKLKNFLSSGTKVELLQEPVESDVDDMDVDKNQASQLFENASEMRAASEKVVNTALSGISPLPDAEKRVPPAWKRVDRVLDVLFWRPSKPKGKSNQKRKTRMVVSDEEQSDEEINEALRLVQEKGEQPPDDLTETLEDWEKHDTLEKSHITKVAWAFIKWDDLGYDEATWDAPPSIGDKNYKAFETAFNRFVDAQDVVVPKNNKKYWDTFDKRNKDDYRKHVLKDASNLDLGQDPSLKLMPFQVDGFNWLCNNWWNHQHCILADEMGLGKTVQIVSFLGNIMKNWKAFPALVVVPNSTITNWVREFERWAPALRVVPFYGEKTARDVIKQFELFHRNSSPGNTNAKFHVLVTTYEALTTGKEFTPVFRNQPRWEVLVVDEGQRLKNDESLLFKKLNELNSIHRIIMTGTPLNNNIRELFNLMNFLDPTEWKDLEALEKQHEDLNLNEEMVKQLHNRLRPYFLRRIKSEVLDLPPKNEVIVPVSMAPLQREVYRSILSHNLNLLNGLTRPLGAQTGVTKGRINNVLMQIRKCLQHPYLYAEDIEPRNLSPAETHGKLIDASGKLRFLKSLLPKLKKQGHRVLLFSQFVIALDIVEDFLQGEGYKFLRLDGSTKGSARQKSMDEFNKPDSEYFIFLLTTRAGGVGINLFTADTVIIFDPDFNPHQDLQAIARSYRYGQKKTCLVFKLMVKDSPEERIIQIGKKKLALDHLIVQKMDDDDEPGGEDVQSILTYGAQALYDSDQNARDIVYTDNDIEKLIEKTKKEAVKESSKAAGGLAFSFAKIWTADKDELEEVTEDDQQDSWAQALQKINEEKDKERSEEMAQSGRGARRKAADLAKSKIQVGVGASDSFTTATTSKKKKMKKKEGHAGSDGSMYSGSEHVSEISDDDDDPVDEDFKMIIDPNPNRQKGKAKADTRRNDDSADCGLCGQRHGPGQCLMMDRSENLAEYREMLILHADDEPWEERSLAIQAIDEILHKRGHLSLIAGQPLHPIPKADPTPTNKIQAPKQSKPSNASTSKVQGPSHYRPSEAAAPSQSSSNGNAHASGSSSAASTVKKQKHKASSASQSECVLCGSRPSHLMKDCPLVKAGSKSIAKQITIFETRARVDPSLNTTVNILRNLLVKYKSVETARTNAAAAQGS
ncbi:hypothetical protein D9613_002145 [Agrocybe pediades]|uniref:Chromatin remodeling factor mit1 n=1 Tax=Agrocybe pediades TaxID=84607 RepID=A0A8H4VWV0_9AGAR|nr:hypothetical protein D9613_002145 [Agrocybe pediades]